MLDRTLLRRVVTVSVVLGGFAALTVLAPLVAAAAVGTDLVRWLRNRTPWMATRLAVFLWIYLAGEVWAVAALGAVGLLGRRRSREATYRLQELWTAWNLRAVTAVFGLSFDIDDEVGPGPGPILVLSRHASLIDTLLPARCVATPRSLRLRYVLKRELLVDPALDIAGNRLPNCFVRRAGGGPDDQTAIRRLADGLGATEGVLIYPEGTRFSAEKREAAIGRLSGRGGKETAARLRHVLPPRPGGTLALLEAAPRADVVVLAHRGLEGFARVRDMWGGELVGSTVRVRLWRIPRSEVPPERLARVEWLWGVWSWIDDWVESEDRLTMGRG
ncbi:MAG: lysophospholipid acyltransferase family protein [Actinomycetota bacterium]